jgi:hypothetical protein
MKKEKNRVKPKSEGAPSARPKMVLLISISDPVKLALYKENLRSNAMDYEVRNETELYVPEDELQTAKAILQEGQWEY